MSLERVVYTDSDGRKKVVLLPEGVPETEAFKGVPVGPPNLAELGLPLEMEVRLNNELYSRNILTATDALKYRSEVLSALQAAFKVDANSIITLFVGRDYENADREKPPENKPNTSVHDRRPRQPR